MVEYVMLGAAVDCTSHTYAHLQHDFAGRLPDGRDRQAGEVEDHHGAQQAPDLQTSSSTAL